MILNGKSEAQFFEAMQVCTPIFGRQSHLTMDDNDNPIPILSLFDATKSKILTSKMAMKD